MKKFIFSLVLMICTVVSVNAQNAYGNNKFFDNWSVGTDAGVTTNLHEWDTPNGGVWGIQLTKTITPVVSFEFSTQLGFNNNANWNVMCSANAVDNVNALGSVKINLMNWFCGYNGAPRLFEISARGGAGYMRNFYPQEVSNDRQYSVGKVGLDFDFNLGKKKAWTVSARPAVLLRGQNGVSVCESDNLCTAYPHNAVGQLTVGVTYHFKTSNKHHHLTQIPPVIKTIEKRGDVRVVEKVVEKRIEKIVTNDVADETYAVAFEQNSAQLSNSAKAILDKIPAKTKVSVIGSTSPEGTQKRNDALSVERAEAVATYLRARGVTVVSATGGEAGRAAIISVVK